MLIKYSIYSKHKMLLIYSMLLVMFSSLVMAEEIDDSYYIKVSGKIARENYYTPAKYYRILNDTSKFLPNTFYIKFKNGAFDNTLFKQQFQNQILKINTVKQPFQITSKQELLLSNKYSLASIYQIHFENNITPFEICKVLNENPAVEYAVPVFKQKLNNFKPNDTYFANQWGLKKILAEQGWEITKGDSAIIIGLVDSGTDIEHNDLKNKIKINYKEIPNDDFDNDENGFVDDYYGWDFVGNITLNDANQYNFKPDNNPKPLNNDNSHGTHTAGIIAAEANNSLGIAGIAINSKIIPVKVAMDNMQSPGSSDIFFGFEGIIYCMERGCDIINLSWEVMEYSPVEEEIIDFVTESGVILIASAGNDNYWADKYTTYPAQYKNVISVGSTDETDKKSSFSQFGYNVDIYAPGSSIYSTLSSNSYGNKSGTSMAAPIVSGSVALLKSIHKDWGTEEVRHQLRGTSDNVLTNNQDLFPFLFGRINLLNLLKYNNTEYPELTKPGLAVSEVLIEGNDEISTFDTVNVKLIIKNYLSAASDIDINIETGDLFVNVYDKIHKISAIPAKSELEIDLKLRITNRNLWYKGNAVLTVHFSGENYKNYQLVNIPISLPSYNKFFVAYILPDDLGLNFFAGDSKSDYVLTAIANTDESNSTGYLLKYRTFVELKKLPNIAHCIYSISDSKNFIGSNGIIFIDSQSGTQTVDVSAIADYVHGIHFFNDTLGFFGGIKSNRIVIAKSNDAGKSWTKISLPSFVGSETHISDYKLFSAKDSIIYFCSKSGKVAYTNDFGNSWKTASIGTNNVEFISVGNINSVIALIYNQNDEQFQVWQSNSTNNWKDINSNLSNFQSYPAYVFSPDSSNSFVILGSHNEVYRSIDSGKIWSVVLSQEYDYHRNTGGTGFLKKDGRIRLWNFSSDLTYLDFDNFPINIYKNLTNLSEKNIDFGTLHKDSSLTKFIFFKNNGNYRTNIDKTIITPLNIESENKFTIAKPLANSVASGAIENLQVKFLSESKGEFKALLEVYSDADTAIHKIELVAKAIDTTGSVIDLINKTCLKIINTNNNLLFSIENDEYMINSISIYNLNGKRMLIKQDINSLNYKIDVTNFDNGMYFAEILLNSEKVVVPIVILAK